MPAPYEKYLAEVLIDEARLQNRIAELGRQLSADYAGCDDLLLLCILKGGVMFLTDLSRHVTVPHMIDFMAASSYGVGARHSAGSVRIDMDLRTDVRGKDVLVVRGYHRQRAYAGFRLEDLAQSRTSQLEALRFAQQEIAARGRYSCGLHRL